jgi:hypothetical protein
MAPPVARVLLGIVLVTVGAIFYRRAETVTWFFEVLGAIGSKTRADEVEPAGWNVLLTKLLGAAGVVAGLFLIVVYGLGVIG